MDFLNKTFAQFSDLFRSMTPGARLTAGLLLGVVVISLVYLFSYQMSPSGVYLMNGQAFQPDQFHRIQAALGAKNLSCTLDGMKIKIPAGRETEYMTALAEGNAIPAGWGDPDGSISNGSIFEDPSTRKQRAKSALEKKLGFWVSGLPNVENAAVTYDKSSGRGFRKKVSIGASVVVKPSGDNIELPKQTVASIRNMVASAISPMNPADVTVVNLGTGTSYAADSEAHSGVFGVEYLENTRNWEEDYTGKISTLLSRIDGVKVAVTVKLDTIESTASKTFTPNKKETAAITTTSKEISRDHEGAAPGGRPGFSSNQATAIRSASAGRGSKENESESESTTTNLVAQTQKSTVSVGMTPQWASASIVVPYSHLVKIWKQENPPGEGEEAKEPEAKDIQPIEQRVTAQIKDVAAGVLPDMKDVADKTAQVTVTVDRDIKPEPLPEPAMTSTAMSWFADNWGMLGVVVLAFVSLSMLRSMIKSTPLESRTAQQPGTALAMESAAPGDGGGEEGADPQQRRLARFAAGGASLRDELSELVHEDPDAAANILRTWIGTPTMKV